MAVLAIVLSVAVPTYASYLARQRLRHVAELLELDLRRARELSVNEGRNLYVSFQSGPQWCWGASRQAACDCATAQPRCEVSGASFRDHKGTLLVFWQAAPTAAEQAYWSRAWRSRVGDGTDDVVHEF